MSGGLSSSTPFHHKPYYMSDKSNMNSPPISGGSHTVQVLGNCEIKTACWLLDRHREFVVKPRNILQQKIEEYLNSRCISFIFKNPARIKDRSYFVDYYIPGFRVLVDIRPMLSSEYFNAEAEKKRRRDLKSLDYVYLPMDFGDLRNDHFIKKLKRALSKSVDNLYKI